MTVKIIGKFQEVDGEEYEKLEDLVRDKQMVGSMSSGDCDVELFYDGEGNTYAVAHNRDDYYGAKENAMTGKTPFVVSMKSLLWTAGLVGLTLYVISNHSKARKHLKYIRN